MKKSPKPVKPVPPRFRVGDRVRILHGWVGLLGEVVEDRGNLGVGGERIYGVHMKVDQWNEMTTEFPESSLEAVPA
ncbi:MAG: hypothetical protein HYS12_16775 [Planctomycetes bacterium]|nr:hypothetical protein [Planctomycetota bacterium]